MYRSSVHAKYDIYDIFYVAVQYLCDDRILVKATIYMLLRKFARMCLASESKLGFFMGSQIYGLHAHTSLRSMTQ